MHRRPRGGVVIRNQGKTSRRQAGDMPPVPVRRSLRTAPARVRPLGVNPRARLRPDHEHRAFPVGAARNQVQVFNPQRI
ncbi:hypothetical protein JCM14469_25080 [Desulfatiferula olefinivorans]